MKIDDGNPEEIEGRRLHDEERIDLLMERMPEHMWDFSETRALAARLAGVEPEGRVIELFGEATEYPMGEAA